MKMKNYFSILLLAAIIFVPFTTSAQVTIGSGEAPHSFSVLELISNQTMGFRLPQMDNDQREALEKSPEFIAEESGAARGLMIFNIEYGCLQVWCGSRWISLCIGEDPS